MTLIGEIDGVGPGREAFDLLLAAARRGEVEHFSFSCEYTSSYAARLKKDGIVSDGIIAAFGESSGVLKSVCKQVSNVVQMTAEHDTDDLPIVRFITVTISGTLLDAYSGAVKSKKERTP